MKHYGTPFDPNYSLSYLNLTSGTIQQLYKNNIATIGDLMNALESHICDIFGSKAKAKQKVLNTRRRVVEYFSRVCDIKDYTEIDIKMPLYMLGFSYGCYETLLINGVTDVFSLLSLNVQSIRHIFGGKKKTIDILTSFQNEYWHLLNIVPKENDNSTETSLKNDDSIQLSTSIQLIGLSVRTVHVLEKIGIETVEDLLKMDASVVFNVRGGGQKTFKELAKYQRDKAYLLPITTDKETNQNVVKNDVSSWIDLVLSEKDPLIIIAGRYVTLDYEISNIPMHIKAKNYLLYNAGDTVLYTLKFYQELIRNPTIVVPKKTKKETFRYYEALLSNQSFIGVSYEHPIIEAVESFFDKYLFNLPPFIFKEEVYALYLANKLENEDNLKEAFFSNIDIVNRFKCFVFTKLFDNGFNSYTQDELFALLGGNLPQDFFGLVLEQCLEKDVEKIGDDYFAKYISINEAVDIYEGKSIDLIREYLKGKTLDEIGKQVGVTRERIRQRIAKDFVAICKMFPVVKEGKYLYFFIEYDTDKQTFINLTQTDLVTYKYCQLIADKRKRRLLEEMLDDPEIDEAIKERYNNEVAKSSNVIFIDGEKVKANKRSIFIHALKTKYLGVKLKTAEMVTTYNNYVKEKNLPSKYLINSNRKGVMFTDLSQIIISLSYYRYYDFDNVDYSNFLKTIDFNNIHNIELSTKVFFLKYPRLMKEYDLYDEFELHNFIKHLLRLFDFEHISLTRMPMISFDDYHREEYYEEILINNPSINTSELAAKIVKEIGMNEKTASYEAYLAIRNHHNANNLHITAVKNALSKLGKLYASKAELSQYLLNEVEGFDVKSFEQVSFLTHIGVYIRNDICIIGYPRMTLFIRHLLEENNGVVDLKQAVPSEIYYGLDRLHNGSLVMMAIKRELFWFGSDSIISYAKLKSFGITYQAIDEYCDSVYDFVDDTYYFSIRTLVNHGHKHKLYDFGFDDYFYAKLLIHEPRQRFVSQRVGTDSYILLKGSTPFKIKDVVLKLFENRSSMAIEEMQRKLKEHYGVSDHNFDKIFEAAELGGLYVDMTLNKIYRSEEDFLLDLEGI